MPLSMDHVQESGSSPLTGLEVGRAAVEVVDDFNIPRSPGNAFDVSAPFPLELSEGCGSEERT